MNQKALQQMMAQAQKMQAQVQKAQAELGNESVEGNAGSYISVTMNGHKEIKAIKIAPDVVDPEDVETLQELIMSAIADATAKANARCLTRAWAR